MCNTLYQEIHTSGATPIKAWVQGVNFEPEAKQQLQNIASLPFIHSHIAVMPDVHLGKGATIGSVIPSANAIIPSAVGVDIGCGMMAVKTSLNASQLPENLLELRHAIEAAIPHGRTGNGRDTQDKGAWSEPPLSVKQAWAKLAPLFEQLCQKHPSLQKSNHVKHLGTMGTGNHFLEVCVDENQGVWVMLHSGSRGVGNRIGSYFIELAKKDIKQRQIKLPDMDLAYFEQGSQHFDDYVEAVEWAQQYAQINREIMMTHALIAIKNLLDLSLDTELAVNCHHNYVAREHHFGKDCYVTRKGAVRARKGELGIIPGSMGERSFIVRGLGNPDSFESCSHGAGRIMSRSKAKKVFNIEDQIKATQGVECRKDQQVIDEIPHAYKDIDAVMAAQKDLVEVVHTLKQVLCVKG